MSGAGLGEDYADAFAIDLPDETASRRFAQDLAIVLRVGDMVSLSGDLGAGKTTLARAILRTLADDETLEVPSPTYTLVQSYETRPKATHFDLYRIASEDELLELGLEEAAETGIVLVEWPERSSLVEEETTLALHLDLAPGGGRRLLVRAAAESGRRVARSLASRAFLERSGRGAARRRPMIADASARRYEYVDDGERRLVLMDAPSLPRGPLLQGGRSYVEIAHIAQDVRPFVALGEWLAARGFSVPRIEASDEGEGLVLLEDLGQERITDADGRPIAERYLATAEALARLHADPVPDAIETASGARHVVPDFDREAMAIEISLLLDWFMVRRTGRTPEAHDRGRFEAAWAPLLQIVSEGERRLVLRDVHSPNVLWQESREGEKRVGLIDFQDAMIGPGAYDLASLAQDARVDMPAELEARIVSAYRRRREGEPGFDAFAFEEAYAIMAAQRATKILGIFTRLAERDGKPQYLRHIPRIQAYLSRTLEHPSLSELRALYEEWGVLEPPSPDRRR